jgi:hypothetical protein
MLNTLPVRVHIFVPIRKVVSAASLCSPSKVHANLHTNLVRADAYLVLRKMYSRLKRMMNAKLVNCINFKDH